MNITDEFLALKKELEEQLRINGMGQERELKLMTELREAKALLKDECWCSPEYEQVCQPCQWLERHGGV